MNFKNSLFILFAVAFFAFVFGEDDPKWVENVNTSVQSTVTVTAGGGDYAGDKSGFVLGGGSGSIVTPEGHIVTNCHVMGNMDQIINFHPFSNHSWIKCP